MNPRRCVLLYSPPVDEARDFFTALLAEHGVAEAWRLLPVMSKSDPRASNLGAILADGVRRVRAACGCGRVAFLGSDCPELPLEAVVAAGRAAAEPGIAAINPAADGGYTLIALPAGADETEAFAGVSWSAADTCLSQLAALTRAGMRCAIGPTYEDVDELPGLRALHARLTRPSADAGAARVESDDADRHTADSDGGSWCPHTRVVLKRLAATGCL